MIFTVHPVSGPGIHSLVGLPPLPSPPLLLTPPDQATLAMEIEGYKTNKICTPVRLGKKLESFPASGNSRQGWHRLMTHVHPVRHQETRH